MKNELAILTPELAMLILTRGQACIVNTADLPRLGQYRWYATIIGHTWYAMTNALGGRSVRKRIAMHTVICGADHVDHVNLNGLDNRRANLRPSTKSQNGANARLSSRSTTGYKGVTQARSGRYVAQIGKDRRRYKLGTYDTPEEAAVAYNAKALELFGEYARLNDLPPKEGLH